MQNKEIFYIILANFLWSFIPIVVVGLFNELSILLVIFYRFFYSGVILFVMAILYVYINNHYTSKATISFKELVQFAFTSNKHFYNMRNIYYLMILGFFGIIMQLIWFFLAIKITTIAFTMIGFILSIVIIAIYEHEVKSEKLDVFKIIYLIMLIFSIGIIIYVKGQEAINQGTDLALGGFIYVIFFCLSITFFHLAIKNDYYTKSELTLINKNNDYKIPRLLIKISITFIMGIIFMFPFIIFLYIFPVQTDLNPEIELFFVQLLNPLLFFKWEVFFLIIFSTIMPYLLVFIAQVRWSSFNLTYSQWSSILTIIEPIGSLFFGYLIINEYFPIEYLMITLFLLTISILLRYAHESINKVNAWIIIEKKQGYLKDLPLRLLKLDYVHCVNSLIGKHDMTLHVKTNSITKLYYLVENEIRTQKGIIDVKILFVNKIIKIDI